MGILQQSKSVSFYTFGCRLNQSETAVLQNSFEAGGYRVVRFGDPTDIVVINTCTVTDQGDADTRRLVNRITRKNAATRIALVGCQSQTQREKLLALPNVQWVVGNARKMELAEIIRADADLTTPMVLTPPISKGAFTVPFSGADREHTRANIKIQDGCDFFCSFCEIPFARGRARSREFTDILHEAKQLANSGHKEVILTGINVGMYEEGEKRLSDVIRALNALPQLERIRLSSIEPTTFSDEICDLMFPSGKLCRYLHVPLQHASDKILRLMNRRYTAAEYRACFEKTHHRVPDLCWGTDVIVGFPGETEDCFAETLAFLESLPLAYLHVFSYSKRSWAKSKDLPAPVPESVITSRSQILRDLSKRKRHLFYKSFVGQTVDVLFEEKKDGWWQGWTDNYVRVKTQSDRDLQNQTGRVLLETVTDHDISGQLIK